MKGKIFGILWWAGVFLGGCVPVPPTPDDELVAKDAAEDAGQSEAYKYAKHEYKDLKKEFDQDEEKREQSTS